MNANFTLAASISQPSSFIQSWDQQIWASSHGQKLEYFLLRLLFLGWTYISIIDSIPVSTKSWHHSLFATSHCSNRWSMISSSFSHIKQQAYWSPVSMDSIQCYHGLMSRSPGRKEFLGPFVFHLTFFGNRTNVLLFFRTGNGNTYTEKLPDFSGFPSFIWLRIHL